MTTTSIATKGASQLDGMPARVGYRVSATGGVMREHEPLRPESQLVYLVVEIDSIFFEESQVRL
jgi:hypothetical protein